MGRVCISPVLGLYSGNESDPTANNLSAKKVGKGQPIRFSVNLTSPSQIINCYVMCDEIGKLGWNRIDERC
jgi:hypothetical protein